MGGNEGVAEVQAVGPGVQHLSPGVRVPPPMRQLSPPSSRVWLDAIATALTCHPYTQDWVLPPAGGGFGTWRSHALAPASSLRPCPPGLPVEAAATLSVNPVTALRLLDDFAALQPGDVVVQNAANSAVGRAVIQMGCARGLRVACIVRDRDGADAVIAELLALGAAAAVRSGHSRSDSVMACLPPGALGLNAVGGPSAGEVARLLRPGAKLVTYGGMSKQPVMLPTAAFIFRDLVACGFWLTSWSRSVSEADMGAALEACAALVRRGQLRVGPMSAVRGLEALPEALRSAAEGDATHKILVRMD